MKIRSLTQRKPNVPRARGLLGEMDGPGLDYLKDGYVPASVDSNQKNCKCDGWDESLWDVPIAGLLDRVLVRWDSG